MLPLQIPKRSSQLAVTDIAAIGKQCLQGRQECRPLVALQRTGGVDDGKRLLTESIPAALEYRPSLLFSPGGAPVMPG